MNLFQNPDFSAADSNSVSGVLEWETNNTATATGDKFTANGYPNYPLIVGGVAYTEGPWGIEYGHSGISPTPGESHTFTVLASSDAPTVTVTVLLGVKPRDSYDTDYSTVLTTQEAAVTAGEPVTRVAVEVMIPAAYNTDNDGGLTVRLEEPSGTGTYIAIRQPWVGLTADVPAEPVDPPTEEPVDPPAGVEDPLAARVAAHIGRAGDTATIAQASVHLATTRAYVWEYTRGRGFTEKDMNRPVPTVEVVIVSACTRLTANPEQIISYTAGDYSERGAILQGFTLPELAVLDNYRRRYV